MSQAAFAQAQLQDTSGEWGEEIVSTSQTGSNRYARTRDGELIAVSNNNDETKHFQIHLFYVMGHKVSVEAKVTGTSVDGNTINGVSVTSADYEEIFSTNLYNGYSFTIPMEIAQGYDIVVKSSTDGNNYYDFYDSREQTTQQRNYDFPGTIKNDNIYLRVEFIKSDLTLDYEYIYELNWDNGAFHESALYIDGKKIMGHEDNGNNGPSSDPVMISESFTLQLDTISKNDAYGYMAFRMDSLSINGQSLIVPDLNQLINWQDSGNPVIGVGKEQTILDSNGETIAVLKDITAQMKGTKNNPYVEYNFMFENVKSRLKVTGGNLKNVEYNEIIYRSCVPSDTASVMVGGSETLDIGEQKKFDDSNRFYTFTFTPEEGYYIKDAEVNAITNDQGQDLSNPWYGSRTRTIYRNNDVRYRTLDVIAEPIKYQLQYYKEDGTVDRLSPVFYLTPEHASQKITYQSTSADPAKTFVGWKFDQNSDTYYTVTQEILRTEFLAHDQNIEYQTNQEGVAYIKVYPYFTTNPDADLVEYSIDIICESTPSENYSVTRSGLKDTVISQSLALEDSEIYEKILELEASGHQLDYNRSTDSITLSQAGQKIQLYFIEKPIKIHVETSNNGMITVIEDPLVAADSSIDTYGQLGQTRSFIIDPVDGVMPEKLYVNGTEVSGVQFVNNGDGTYTLEYTIPDTTDANRTFNLSIGFVEVELYTLQYDLKGQSSETIPEKEVLSNTEETLTTTVPTATDPAVKFKGWTETDYGTAPIQTQAGLDAITMVTSVTVDTDPTTVYAVWIQDENGDNIPDGDQKLTLTFDVGDHGTASGTTEYELQHGDSYPAAPSVNADAGWTFKGWYKGDVEYTAGGAVTIPDGSQGEAETYTAVYEKDAASWATVTFTTDPTSLESYIGGVALEQEVNLAAGAKLVGTPVLNETADDGYVFEKWTRTAGGQTVDLASTVVWSEETITEDTVYTAVYADDKNNDGKADKDQKLTLTFDAGDHGTASGTTEYELQHGDSYPAAPSVNADAGWTFKGWYKGDVEYTAGGAVTIPDGSQGEAETYTAVYEKDAASWATVTFTTDPTSLESYIGGVALEQEVNLAAGAKLVGTPVLNETADDGYVFEKWTRTAGGQTVDLASTVVWSEETITEDTVYTAVYADDKNNDGKADKDQKLTLTFDAGDHGTASGTTEYELQHGDSYPAAPSVNADAGWTFKGWYKGDVEYTAGGAVTIPDGSQGEAETYTAVYEKDAASWATVTFTTDPTSLESYIGGVALEQEVNLAVSDKLVGSPVLTEAADDDYVFEKWTRTAGGQTVDLESPVVWSDETITVDTVYTAVYADDKNNNDVPDKNEIHLTFIVEDDKATIGAIEGTDKYVLTKGQHAYPDAPKVINLDKSDQWTFDKWAKENGDVYDKAGTLVDPNAIDETYVAVFAEDKNENEIPDYRDTKYTIVYDPGIGMGTHTGPTDILSETEVTLLPVDDAKAIFIHTDAVFIGWSETRVDAIQTQTPSGLVTSWTFAEGETETTKTFYAVYAEDKDGNETPDYLESLLTYNINGGYGAVNTIPAPQKHDIGSSVDLYQFDLKQDAVNYLYKEVDGRNVTAIGWTDAIHKDIIADNAADAVRFLVKSPLTMPEDDVTLYALYAIDEDKDNIPDYVEGLVTLVFDKNGGTGTAVAEIPEKEDHVIAALVELYQFTETKYLEKEVDGTHLIAVGWTDDASRKNEIVESADGLMKTVLIPDAKDTELPLYVVYAEDTNKNYIPDYAEDHFTLTFNTNGGTPIDPVNDMLTGTVVNVADKTTTKADALFLGWTTAQNVPAVVRSAKEAEQYPTVSQVTLDQDKTLTAVFAVDRNENGVPDYEESSGGSSSSSGSGSYTAGVDGHWVHVDPENSSIPITKPVPEGATPVTAPEYHKWKFELNNGSVLYSRWAYIKNPYATEDQPGEGWFVFDNNGIMQYGWYLDTKTGRWYYLHRESDGMLGTMETGWHYDSQDGKWYYLNPKSGEMLVGWQKIDGKWYYFNPNAPKQTWDYNKETGGWTYNGSNSRPYGSMYQNEMTPDGHFVDENGVWKE
ncbi:MAG: N-acetylmuramoyl-L-alanine amidase family protein [Lachnospiraceae bacterium]